MYLQDYYLIHMIHKTGFCKKIIYLLSTQSKHVAPKSLTTYNKPQGSPINKSTQTTRSIVFENNSFKIPLYIPYSPAEKSQTSVIKNRPPQPQRSTMPHRKMRNVSTYAQRERERERETTTHALSTLRVVRARCSPQCHTQCPPLPGLSLSHSRAASAA